ncbi:dNA polymerase [Clostridium sp. CAG:524]|nr:dNA polymerase [Clostridium sp. CAG:524]
MKKRAILIDGNNLLFRSYYATAYNGNLMKNSKGFPTNALFGFVNMLNKIINEEKPEYIMVAFDTGHNFRKDLCDTYKDGRIETPNDLKIQFPEAKKICTLLGIKYIECDNYEADDIIGTFARMADEDKNYNATIISSDKDLLQLISDEVDVKLLKQKDYILMNEQTFFDHYGIKPIRMIDLKALMGDPSDNIPGVKGIGEKTALSLLVKYDTLDNLYNHLDELTPKTKEKLLNDKESAFFSYKLATIYKTIDFDYTFESIKYNKPDITGLIEKYKELEFNSFLKNLSVNNEENNNETPYEIVKTKINIEGIKSLYIELDDTNYHKANFIGASIYDGKKAYYFDLPSLLLNSDLLKDITATFDNKKNIVFLNRYNIDINDPFDIFIAAYLLEYNVKDDIAYLSAAFNKNIAFYDQIVSKKNILTPESIRNSIVCKAKFIYETYQEFKDKLVTEELDNLYIDIEGPLIRILANMEINGISVKTDVIDKLKNELNEKIALLENKIHEEAGMDFNIGSHKQMGDVLYNKLMLPKGKGKNAMSTSHEVLIKLRHLNPIIDDILDYRALTKLVSTYLETFNSYVMEDGKIHTIYKQTGTRTGRLSSVEPNLQNIPVRSEEGKQIRKAFIPSENSYLLSSDYSQIELRVLAHISNSRSLKNAFINGEDIHTHVASDIFDVPENEVTKNMRRTAKAVIFGIVYGISGYGLGENLDISPNEAKKYIEKYLTLYPEVNEYMTEIVKKAKETSSVRTLLNRKRTIDELNNTNYMIRQMGERIALNTPIQGTAADILKLAMIRIDEKLKEDNLKTKMLLQVHDELIFDVPDEELNIVIDIVREIMENVYKLSVPLKVEIDYGRDWYEAK